MTAPEKPPFGAPPFATRIPGRSPEWKAHMSAGQAKSALSCAQRSDHRPDGSRGMLARAGELWKWDGTWRLVTRVEPGTFVDELPWKTGGLEL